MTTQNNTYGVKDYMQWASEIHDLIEDELRVICRPSAKVIEIVQHIENRIDDLTDEYVISKNLPNNINRGKAFPVGININDVAAHWSPLNESDTDIKTNYIIQQTDVVTIDYGIHFNGYILDAAFSFAYDEKHKNLLQCGLEACQSTANLVKNGQQIYTLSKNIMKVAKKYNFSLIKDLCGHQITQYKIHNGIVVPNCDMNLKKSLSVGTIFTIEPFVSTGQGNIAYTNDISHYMFNYHAFDYDKLLRLKQIPDFLQQYTTLAFNRRHILESENGEVNLAILDDLVKQKIYQAYPPILETNSNAYVCQFETTLYIESANSIINYKKHKSIDNYLLI